MSYKTPLARGFVLSGESWVSTSGGDANGASGGGANPNGGDASPSDDDPSRDDDRGPIALLPA